MLKLIAIGNLGQDAVVRHANGKQVVNFSIAHNERYTDAQGVRQERTEWVECEAWGDKWLKLAQYLRKGTQVFVEGAPYADSYVQKDSGELMSKQRMRVRAVELLSGGADQSNNGQPQQQSQQPYPQQQAYQGAPVPQNQNPATNWHPANGPMNGAQPVPQGQQQYGPDWHK